MTNFNINELQDKVLAGELTVSQSPYSDSWYIMKSGEEISWGEKPEGSTGTSVRTTNTAV